MMWDCTPINTPKDNVSRHLLMTGYFTGQVVIIDARALLYFTGQVVMIDARALLYFTGQIVIIDARALLYFTGQVVIIDAWALLYFTGQVVIIDARTLLYSTGQVVMIDARALFSPLLLMPGLCSVLSYLCPGFAVFYWSGSYNRCPGFVQSSLTYARALLYSTGQVVIIDARALFSPLLHLVVTK